MTSEFRQCLYQCFCIRMARCIHHLLRFSFFHHLSAVHNQNPVAYLRNKMYVVAYKYNGKIALFFKPQKQRHNLRLYRHIKRSRRFVRNQKSAVLRKCKRNANTLKLSSAELVRIGRKPPARIRKPYFFKQFFRPAHSLLL